MKISIITSEKYREKYYGFEMRDTCLNNELYLTIIIHL